MRLLTQASAPGEPAADPSANRRSVQPISFLTPYWSGSEMMRLHLASIRKFHPAAPILVSQRGGDAAEMDTYRNEFAIQYWLEDCAYEDALLRLLERCESDYVCVLDHDTVLLSSLFPLLDGLVAGLYDLVGVEERIRAPAEIPLRLSAASNGWMRFAPGFMDATFLMFNLREFRRRWGLRGIRGTRSVSLLNREFHYGLCERLNRHKYLLPFHTAKYGFGNLLKDEGAAVLWHQWYGSYRTRLAHQSAQASDPDAGETGALAAKGELAFLADYPDLDLSDLVPAWGPGRDIGADLRALASGKRADFGTLAARAWGRMLKWRSYGARGMRARALARLDRWRRLR